MAVTNHERVGKALELLKAGLVPFVERELKEQYAQLWFERAKGSVSDLQSDLFGNPDKPKWDAAALLAVMWNQWNEVFRKVLGQAERTLVSEIKEVRNRWAHQQPFSSDDTYRALDSANRLLTAVSASEAAEVEKMKMELLRVRFDEQVRTEKRRSAGAAIESEATGSLSPWREVVNPHQDVASGNYQQAEFAADLWQVHLGEGAPEYRDPVEFFRRTYLTESLHGLLAGALRRTAGSGGDPVVQLQTNFGGGKTHSMLALYHLFSGAKPTELLGIDAIMQEAKLTTLPPVKRVVLVGNRISPGNPSTKPDGTIVRTLWGELAWQLERQGVAGAFARIKADDERATNPGDALRELFVAAGPCLILIDEWVAYARQLHEGSDLPAGSFETHFTFAQALTETAKVAMQCLLVISLPASDTSGSPHAVADDVEVGGERGRAALDRLKNAVGRVEASWRPASAEEGFEIVRRRLFEPLVDRSQFVTRDRIAASFFDLYRTQNQEFPPEVRDTDYEKRLRAAYPIHPEVFDRLYSDWSTLVKFQRTRGVLRLMAAVIHSLWEKGDRNPLIMPANIPIDDPHVQFELTRYLSDNWVPVIEKDVDGPSALPLRIDRDVPNLGKYSATRRVARTIYLGSAPLPAVANRAVDDRRVKLGCVMPGESPAVFGDALRRLSTAATFLYHDGVHYWYSTQPTVTKLAEDRAEELIRRPEAVVQEIERRVRADLRATGDFRRVHPFPTSGHDIPDDLDARLVVLDPDHPYSKTDGTPAAKEAASLLQSRGNAPRLFRNTLVLLAVDQTRIQDLDEAVRRFLAWESILAEKDKLDLTPQQVRQAESQRSSADTVVSARLPEAYQWLMVPTQESANGALEWSVLRLTGTEPLAVRVSKKLRNDELMIPAFAPTLLRRELDNVPLWRGSHVAIKQLVEDFASYLYLPRLRESSVLIEAIRAGLSLLTWEKESFAYADGFDEASGEYRGLRSGHQVSVVDGDPGMLVQPEAALRQMGLSELKVEPERPQLKPGASIQFIAKAVNRQGEQIGTPQVTWSATGGEIDSAGLYVAGPSEGEFTVKAAAPTKQAAATITISKAPAPPPPKELPKPSEVKPVRFHGSVDLDATRAGRDAGRIAEEIIVHLTGLVGAKVRVSLEIEAEVPGGVPENVVRTVTENARTLKFTSQGFEEE